METQNTKPWTSADQGTLCNPNITNTGSQNNNIDDSIQALSLELSKVSERNIKEAMIDNETEGSELTLKWCAHCKRESITEHIHTPTHKTFWSAVGIFISGGIFGCFLLPYVSSVCQESRSRCRRCNHFI